MNLEKVNNDRHVLVSIHDHDCVRVGFLDNEKPGALHYYNDNWHRYLTEGSSTFDFTVWKGSGQDVSLLNEEAYVSFTFEYQEHLFKIRKIEETETELTCYCESTNLELLNEEAPVYEATKSLTLEEYFELGHIVGDTRLSNVVIGTNEVKKTKKKLSWSSRETKLARLLSVVDSFGAECEFVTELNRNGTLNCLRINIYKKHDDDHQGVGTRRVGKTLYYGEGINSIRRTVDITDIISSITPTGSKEVTTKDKDGKETKETKTVTLAGYPESKIYDSDDHLLYYVKNGAIWAPQTRDRFPSTLGPDSDKWIVAPYETDASTQDDVYEAGLAQLKILSEPSIEYEIEGDYDLDIGDTIIVHDQKFEPALILEARVSEQEYSFTDPTQCKNTFSNVKALENKLSSSILSRMQMLIDEATPIVLDVVIEGSTVMKSGSDAYAVLTGRLTKGESEVYAESWTWYKDGEQISTGSIITIDADDISGSSVYRVEAVKGARTYTKTVTMTQVKDGLGISDLKDQYTLSSSTSTNDGSDWSDSTVEYVDGKAVWSRYEITWDDGSKTYTSALYNPSATVGYQASFRCGELEADNANIKGSLSAHDAHFTELETDTATIKGKLEAAEADITDLTTAHANVTGRLEAAEGNITTLTADTATISGKLEAAEGNILTLTTDNATVKGRLDAAEGNITTLTTENTTVKGRLDAAEAVIDNLDATYAKITTLNAATGRIDTLETGYATVNTALIGKADIDLANVQAGSITTAMIGEGVVGTAQIADGSITDAKIVGLTASKITAGTLDAGTIDVVNLNADNITVGTINGQLIGAGTVDMNKLSEGVVETIDTLGVDIEQAKADIITAQNAANNAQTSANTAQATADGKNTVYRQSTTPSTSNRKTGDVWFDTANDNRIYIWSGSAWTLSELGEDAIANLAITNAKIADATIQSAKIANLDAGKITTGTLDANRIAAGSIVASKIASNAITADKIAANAITSAKIQAGAVTASAISSSAVTADKISSGAITADKIAASAITADKIVAGAITTDKIAAKAITANELATGCITASNGIIASIDASKITTGTLDAERIAAGSLSVGQLGDLQMGGRNLVLNSETRTPDTYGEASLTIQSGQTVSEWSTANAIRVSGTKGTSNLFAILPTGRNSSSDPSSVSLEGQNYIHSIHIKNLGDALLVQNNNLSSTGVTVGTGETKRVILSGTGDGTRYLQFTFGIGSGTNIDFYCWHPQIETGTVVSDWTPAPEDVNTAIAEGSIANWCYDNNMTYIDGGNIYTGTIEAKSIKAGTITADKIATGTITSASGVIGSLDAGDIKTGTLSADRIGAKSITVDKIDTKAISVGSRNLILNSTTRQITSYSGDGTYTAATMTTTTGVAVSEWGAKDAFKCSGTASSASNGLLGSLVTGRNSSTTPTNIQLDQEYVGSIYIKNNHSSNTVKVYFNGYRAASSEQVVINPGECKRITCRHTGNTTSTYGIQMNFYSGGGASSGYNFTYWHPQIEVGYFASDWSPAPEDISVENIYSTGTTTIDGGKITSGSITADKINATDLEVNHVISKNADDIKTYEIIGGQAKYFVPNSGSSELISKTTYGYRDEGGAEHQLTLNSGIGFSLGVRQSGTFDNYTGATDNINRYPYFSVANNMYAVTLQTPGTLYLGGGTGHFYGIQTSGTVNCDVGFNTSYTKNGDSWNTVIANTITKTATLHFHLTGSFASNTDTLILTIKDTSYAPKKRVWGCGYTGSNPFYINVGADGKVYVKCGSSALSDIKGTVSWAYGGFES